MECDEKWKRVLGDEGPQRLVLEMLLPTEALNSKN